MIALATLVVNVQPIEVYAQWKPGLQRGARTTRQQQQQRQQSARYQQRLLDDLFSSKKTKKKKEKEVIKDSVSFHISDTIKAVAEREELIVQDTVNAQESKRDVQMIVTGEGSSKDRAVQVALRSAIEQAFGVFISSNTQILNDELVKDEIATVTTGNIKNYEILSETNENGKYLVTIRTVVSVDKLIEYTKQHGGSTELAGALFAANYKMEELNRQNIRKAHMQLRSQMKQIIPTIFDLEIVAHNPTEREVQITPGYSSTQSFLVVPITVKVKANKNIDALKKLYITDLRIWYGYQTLTDEEIFNLSYKHYERYYDMVSCLMENILKFEISDGNKKYSLRSGVKPIRERGKAFKGYIEIQTRNGAEETTTTCWHYSDDLLFVNNRKFPFYGTNKEYSLDSLLSGKDYLFVLNFDIIYSLNDLEKVKELNISIPSLNK